jgi:molecular chaperone DnaJ
MVARKRRSYYEILGVSLEAGPESLKKAYRELAKKYHPDRKPGDADAEECFKEIQEAYCVLKDPVKRDRYDADVLGMRKREQGREGPSCGSRAQGGKSGVSEAAEDIFEFLRSRMEDRGKRGEDLRYMVSLTFEEAALGAEKVIRIPKRKDCPSCKGRGWKNPEASRACKLCRGEGEITLTKRGRKQVLECPGCGGRGLLDKEDCDKCNGKGKLPYRVQRRISIPPGVDNGSRLKVRGEGGAGEKGGANGDLYIVIQIQDHPVFVRRNLDVCCDVAVHFTQAVLGATIEVPTLEGSRSLRIPAGTQNGAVFTLQGCGFPRLDGSRRGDQQVRIQVEVPRRVSEREKELLRVWQGMQRGLS